ncbi:MAG: FISUMP domain-containing protein [Paludibacter sp.]|jgi:uncharacterized protein (TIGR02145 family)
MKTNYILVLSLFLAIVSPSFGLNYTITFTGSGASTTVGSVQVKNLATGATVTVPEGNSLLLSDATAVDQVNASSETIHVYPNSSEGTSTVSFFAKQTGNAKIEAFTVDGKKVAGLSHNVLEGANSFQLSLPKGAFVVKASGDGYSYTAKFINKSDAGKSSITYSGKESSGSSKSSKSKAAVTGTTMMAYAADQRLLYTGTSGTNSTILVDTPYSDSEMEFFFTDCTDGSGNHYKVVQIGTQIWMAEDLKTTKYNDGTDITAGTAELWNYYTAPAYVPTSVSTAPTVFYNWFAANTANIAPTGFKVPTKDEFATLVTTTEAIVGSDVISGALADNTGWRAETGKIGMPGDNLNENNLTGFSAVGNGYYGGSWSDGAGHVMPIWLSDEWIASEGNICAIYSDYLTVYFYSTIKSSGSVIRCFKSAI